MKQRSDNISYSEVGAAIEALLLEGKKPTIRDVRVQLGDRGSSTTISEMVRKYNQSNAISEILGSAHLSTTVTGAIIAEIKKFCSQETDQLQRRVETAEEDTRALLEENSELHAECKRVSQDLSKAAQEIARLNQSNEIDTARASTRLETSTLRIRELEKEIGELKSRLLEADRELIVARNYSEKTRELQNRLEKEEGRSALLETELRSISRILITSNAERSPSKQKTRNKRQEQPPDVTAT